MKLSSPALAVVLLLAGSIGSTAVAQDLDFLGSGRLRISHRRDNAEMLTLVRPVTDTIRDSIVQVFCGGKPVSLATVVGVDGYVLTKHSELTSDPIRVRLNSGEMISARIAAVRRQNDLALLKIDAKADMTPVKFIPDSPPVGSFLITVGRNGRPLGVGSVGVRARRVEHQGRLGVVLHDGAQGRAQVQGVWPGSGADEAGIVPGDQILAINGQQEYRRADVIERLRGMFPGENVRLTILRGSDTLEMDAGIREFGIMQESENDSKVNGRRNTRLSGFDRVIQHDTVLAPDECGSPVIDSSGRVLGINIARAGRVVSYTLPASLIIPEMVSMLSEARGNGAN